MRRSTRAAVAVVIALAGATLAPSAAHADTVCANAVGAGSYQNVVGKGGDLVARVWYHATTSGKTCTVLRAVKWKGTPHYMYVRSCQGVAGPPPLTGVNCSGFDAGKYASYAGPLYWGRACATKVIVDAPSGDRVFNGFIYRCD